MIGVTIGHYRILEKLGEGGMGQVYRAQDLNLDRQVAIKMLPPTLATDPNRLGRLKREAQVLATLDHPNIVAIYAVDKIDEVPFLAMELVEGKNLSDFIGKGGLSLHDFFEVAIPLTEALSVAHERGIIHRDLKPSNIMVSKDGHVKVLDFGLAKVRQLPGDAVDPNASTEALTVEGHILGTMPYMAPEQVQGLPVDQRSDIFSLGIVLYQMATGHRPFKGANSAELISSILRDEPNPVDELKREMPHHLGRIIRQCLEKEPVNRLESAKDVHIQLGDLRREITTDHRRSAPGSPGALEDPAPPAYKSRLPRWGTTLIAVLALVVAAAVWVFGVRQRPFDPLGPEAQELFQQAELFEQRGNTRQNLVEAEERYRRALALEAGHPLVKAKLAALLAGSQRLYPQEGQAEEASELAASNLGAIYFELGQMEKAIEAYERAYRMAPQKAYAPYNIGETYEFLGDLAHAQDWYEKAMVNFDDAIESGGPRAQLLALRSLCAVKLGRKTEALSGVEEALELDPSNTNRIFNAAQVAALAGESELLFSYIKRAIELGHPRQGFYTDSAFKAYQNDPELMALLESELDS